MKKENFSKGNYIDKYKNQCHCILVCNSSLCILYDLKDRYIKKIKYFNEYTMYKDVIYDNNNIKE